MTKFQDKTFSVVVGDSKAYRDGWEQTFRGKETGMTLAAAEELFDETDTDTIEEWLSECEEANEAVFSDWEIGFLASVRDQFDEKRDSEHPLSGAQLVKLKQVHDKLSG